MTNNTLAEALEQCRAQFQFYADEHTKADKTEKAATNQRFADMCAATLRASTDAAAVGDESKKLAAINKEATRANDVIRLNRHREGQGMITVATALHRIAEWSSVAHPPVADAAVAGEVRLMERFVDFIEVMKTFDPKLSTMLDFGSEVKRLLERLALSHPAPAEPVGLREAKGYADELRQIAGMVAQTPDGPLRWKQYRLTAAADFLATLTRTDEAQS